jgi:hypothetical protein
LHTFSEGSLILQKECTFEPKNRTMGIMKKIKGLALVLLGLAWCTPNFATVQPNHASTAGILTAAAAGDIPRSEARGFARARKLEIKNQQKAERYWRSAPERSFTTADRFEQGMALLLCFFLGTLGLHRLYLQAEPIVILWYFISIGGFFGLIPLIDFIRLIMGQTDHYRGNSNLFRAFQ